MKYLKTNNGIRVIEEGQEFLIQNDWIEITEDEAILIANPPKTPEEIEKEETIKLKEEKTNRLNSIVVTTSNNNSFDGNESARNNMLSAIISSETLNTAEDTWKLADNTQKLISLVELKEALALSILEVGKIVRDYE